MGRQWDVIKRHFSHQKSDELRATKPLILRRTMFVIISVANEPLSPHSCRRAAYSFIQTNKKTRKFHNILVRSYSSPKRSQQKLFQYRDNGMQNETNSRNIFFIRIWFIRKIQKLIVIVRLKGIGTKGNWSNLPTNNLPTIIFRWLGPHHRRYDSNMKGLITVNAHSKEVSTRKWMAWQLYECPEWHLKSLLTTWCQSRWLQITLVTINERRKLRRQSDILGKLLLLGSIQRTKLKSIITLIHQFWLVLRQSFLQMAK